MLGEKPAEVAGGQRSKGSTKNSKPSMNSAAEREGSWLLKAKLDPVVDATRERAGHSDPVGAPKNEPRADREPGVGKPPRRRPATASESEIPDILRRPKRPFLTPLDIGPCLVAGTKYRGWLR